MKHVLAVLVLFTTLLTFHQTAFAGDDLNIVQIMRNIPLADDEAVIKDFYISGPSLSALKKDLVVTAIRKMQIRDATGSQSYGEIQVPVAQLRILAVYDKVAIAREYQDLSRLENPMLEQVGILYGDSIELKGSFVDSKPRPAAKK